MIYNAREIIYLQEENSSLANNTIPSGVFVSTEEKGARLPVVSPTTRPLAPPIVTDEGSLM